MKKTFLSLLSLCVFVATAHAQLVYRISGNGLEKPSYILGTHHLANVSFIQTLVEWKEAFNATDQVYGEVVTQEAKTPENVKKMTDAMMLPEGKTLPDVLTPDQLKRLNACLKDLMGTDFNNPAMLKQMGRMTPVALSTQLAVVLYLKNHMGEFDPTQQIDDFVQQQAHKNNEPVGGLETLDEQINLLYKSKPLDKQIKDLMCFVDNRDFQERMMETISKAYYEQDMAAVQKAFEMKMNNSCDPSPEEWAALLDDRNKKWMEKMPAIMEQRPTLFVVGAGHLPGKNGVLSLLRNAGYTVTPADGKATAPAM